jgi:hypothetical protein
MTWDKFRMAQRFLQKANAIHPEDERENALRDEALALQDVYYDCYMSSFSREDLLKRLTDVVDGDFEMPDEENVDEAVYRATYIKEARILMTSIENGELK